MIAIALAAGSVIALALLVRPAVGALWGLILILYAALSGYWAWRGRRRARRSSPG